MFDIKYIKFSLVVGMVSFWLIGDFNRLYKDLLLNLFDNNLKKINFFLENENSILVINYWDLF